MCRPVPEYAEEQCRSRGREQSRQNYPSEVIGVRSDIEITIASVTHKFSVMIVQRCTPVVDFQRSHLRFEFSNRKIPTTLLKMTLVVERRGRRTPEMIVGLVRVELSSDVNNPDFDRWRLWKSRHADR